MPVNLRCLFFAMFGLMPVIAPPAIAQPSVAVHPAAPSESITVTGIKDVEAAVSKFVGAMTAPTRVAGKLARWKDGVCPITVGLRPEIAKFVSRKVKDIAAQAGAPVNGKDSCQPNIEIVFTTTPQALLDNIRVMHPVLLGYHDNSAQAERMATVTRPIQSWYSTATQDALGHPQVDSGRSGGISMQVLTPEAGGGGPSSGPAFFTMNMPNASAASVTGNRLGDGLSSGLNHVVIVAEPAKLLEYEVGTLADYIAMLALSQIQAPETCQDLPSILNLLVPGCSRTASALTSGDMAYLRALYKMTPTASFQVQRSEMMYQMDQSLVAPR
jgi:hypothetical protein